MTLTTFLLNIIDCLICTGNPIKVRFIIVSPKSFIRPLARTIASVVRLFFKQVQTNNAKCRFFTSVNTFWVVQNNRPVTDEMNGFNKRRKVNSVSSLDFSALYTKLSRNKRLMVVSSLIDFCFDGGEIKHITVNSYGTTWEKNIKDNLICLNKQEIKYAVAYFFLIVFLLLAQSLSAHILVVLWGLILLHFLANLLLYFYESK